MSTSAGIHARFACRLRWRAISVSVVVMAFLCSPIASRADSVSAQRSQDEIWLVSERHIGYLESGQTPPLETRYYDSAVGWREGDLADLLAPSSLRQIVLVYVHGNRISSGEAASAGRCVYQLISSQIDDSVSIRYVIWSWPSSRIPGQLKDFRVKARRTELGGYCLGWFLAQLPPEQRISLLGYSFGARIVTGALHLRGGGELCGRVLPSPEPEALGARVVLVAAAVHRSWLGPGGYHEQALANTDHLLNIFNSQDAILKRYRFLYKCSRPEAFGYTGIPVGGLGAASRRIEQCDARHVAGHSHALFRYLGNSCLRKRIQPVLCWEPFHGELSSHASALSDSAG
ncbi:MAG: hypothetical protein ACODAD_00030 [Planctomycetota bacterium]